MIAVPKSSPKKQLGSLITAIPATISGDTFHSFLTLVDQYETFRYSNTDVLSSDMIFRRPHTRGRSNTNDLRLQQSHLFDKWNNTDLLSHIHFWYPVLLGFGVYQEVYLAFCIHVLCLHQENAFPYSFLVDCR